ARQTGGTAADELANAAARGDLQRLRELLDGAADPNAVNSYGRTPIQVRKPWGGEERGDMRAAGRGQPPLRARGAAAAAPGQSPGAGRPPTAGLGCCRSGEARRGGSYRRSGKAKTLAALHRAGARLDLPDGRGRLPLDVAAGGPHGAVGRYLR
ncbi:CDN2B inhibitor, partial [Himantopus himantopus]|nr:CDN2B inhibitor [Himantopus himantopus]